MGGEVVNDAARFGERGIRCRIGGRRSRGGADVADGLADHGAHGGLIERLKAAVGERGEYMGDYDLSFERLAAAVDAAAEARQGARWEGPDLRMRCTTTDAVYEWPEGAPYDGGAPVT
ncbi:hypothetical protein [Streptomyces sp. NRRL S-237]|uniref:hypothetical protein n=1 Tax=Streptomyces sp. NRRL S-237 TaxID=1463895 RepID=UPI000A571494|nr:hypothetical protein [Streptomyces sp. NRRL S-237]